MTNGKLKFCTLLLCALSPLRGFADPSEEYKQGLLAFKEKDYDTALRYFRQAESHGMRQPTLSYNLGSTYFKLGDYAQAKLHYDRLATDPQWGALATYNLGLIAERGGDVLAAQRYYTQAYERTSSAKLRAVIEKKLQRDDGAVRNAIGWSGYVAVSGGYDDNVVLASDSTATDISGRSDQFYEVLGIATGYISGDADKGVRLDIGALVHNYESNQEFDFAALSATLSHDRRYGVWLTQTALKADTYLVDDARHSSMGSFRLEGYRPLRSFNAQMIDALSINVIEEFSRIDGSDAYAYLSGWRNRTAAELVVDAAPHSLRLGYQLELNDRRDLRTADEFFSYSPTGHQFYMALRTQIGSAWSVEGRAEVETHRYRDKNRELDVDNTLLEKSRSDRRSEFSVRVTRTIAARWGVFAEYRYTDSRANIRRYSYENNQAMLGLEAVL